MVLNLSVHWKSRKLHMAENANSMPVSRRVAQHLTSGCPISRVFCENWGFRLDSRKTVQHSQKNSRFLDYADRFTIRCARNDRVLNARNDSFKREVKPEMTVSEGNKSRVEKARRATRFPPSPRPLARARDNSTAPAGLTPHGGSPGVRLFLSDTEIHQACRSAQSAGDR